MCRVGSGSQVHIESEEKQIGSKDIFWFETTLKKSLTGLNLAI